MKRKILMIGISLSVAFALNACGPFGSDSDSLIDNIRNFTPPEQVPLNDPAPGGDSDNTDPSVNPEPSPSPAASPSPVASPSPATSPSPSPSPSPSASPSPSPVASPSPNPSPSPSPAASPSPSPSPSASPPVTGDNECNDGIDNDGDGLIDADFDFGCYDYSDPDEGGRASMTQQNGWTLFEPSSDTRMIYVSAAGSDSNNGLSPSTPKRTIAAGRALLRNGFPDWLLLRRGDIWSESLGTSWNLSGRSFSEKMVIKSYGSLSNPRPTITGVYRGIDFSSSGASHLALADFRMVGLTDDRAVDGHAPISDILFENFYLDAADFSFQPVVGGVIQPTDISLRRSVIQNAGPAGLFANETLNFLVEGAIFYNNGLSDEIRAHNIYMSGNNGPDAESGYGRDSRGNVVRNSFLLKASGNFAIKWRAQFDGTIERNVMSLNRNSASIHTKWANEYSLNTIFRENAIFDQGNSDTPSSVHGLEIAGAQDVLISDNIIANNTNSIQGGNPAILIAMPQYDSNGNYTGLFFPSPSNITIRDNIIHGWNGHNMLFGNALNMPLNNYENIQILNNDIQNISPDTGIVKRLVYFTEPARFGANGVIFSGNRYWSMWAADTWFRLPSNATYSQWLAASGETGSTSNQVNYSDPNRNLGTYATQMGLGPDVDDFVDSVTQQERGHWDPRLEAEPVINYIRQGFNLPALP